MISKMFDLASRDAVITFSFSFLIQKKRKENNVSYPSEKFLLLLLLVRLTVTETDGETVRQFVNRVTRAVSLGIIVAALNMRLYITNGLSR